MSYESPRALRTALEHRLQDNARLPVESDVPERGDLT